MVVSTNLLEFVSLPHFPSKQLWAMDSDVMKNYLTTKYEMYTVTAATIFVLLSTGRGGIVRFCDMIKK